MKLYDEKLLQGLSQDLALVDKLRTTLKRAYQMYAQRSDASPEGAATFREAAMRILADGNATLLEPALSEALRAASPYLSPRRGLLGPQIRSVIA